MQGPPIQAFHGPQGGRPCRHTDGLLGHVQQRLPRHHAAFSMHGVRCHLPFRQRLERACAHMKGQPVQRQTLLGQGRQQFLVVVQPGRRSRNTAWFHGEDGLVVGAVLFFRGPAHVWRQRGFAEVVQDFGKCADGDMGRSPLQPHHTAAIRGVFLLNNGQLVTNTAGCGTSIRPTLGIADHGLPSHRLR